VHTLKGSAGVVGLAELSRVAHRMEDLLQTLYEGGLALDETVHVILRDSHQVLDDLVGHDGEIEALRPRIDTLFDAYRAVLSDGVDEGAREVDERELGEERFAPMDGFVEFDSALPASGPGPGWAEPERDDDQSPASPRRSAPPRSSTIDPTRLLRIPLDRVDDLVRLVGELSVNRSVFQRRFAQLEQQVDELGLGTDRVRRVAAQLEAEREFRPLSGAAGPVSAGAPSATASTVQAATTEGFDPIEMESYTEIDRMSRQLTEAGADISALRGHLERTVGEFDQSLDRLGRIASEIQDRLLRLRMVPVGRLAPRMRRAARRTAAEQGKRVEVRILGEAIELDKTLLDELTDPLLHLARNAIDHGIETPEVRRALGKPPAGRFQLAAYSAGPEVVLELSDDGAGLDEPRLRQTAAERGLLNPAELESVSDRELFNLIFLPGFSTASELSEISGRGVGLDVVKTTISRLKGSVTVSSEPGRGTKFTIRLPMTLALTRVAIVLAGGQRVAVPLAGIRRITRWDGAALDAVGDQPVLNIGDRALPLLSLADVLGTRKPPAARPADRIVLVMSVGDQEIALGVEQLLEGREAVVKSLGSHLHPLTGVSGATILGDGSVVLILNLAELLEEAGASSGTAFEDHGAPAGTTAAGREVLIVDDSLTVRRALSRIVSEAGWNPVPAADGLEALELLEDRPWPPEAILLDLEMPRMDGYQLTATLRARERHRDIPIIIVTSRSSDRHRRKAFEQGADEFLVKPLNDRMLVECIRRLTAERGRTVH
ncbi:MAG: response regulator, partial [Acidobacteriota bacterium]